MLRSLSVPAYEVLRLNSMTVNPLPSKDTLSRRIKSFKYSPGFQVECLNFLRLKLCSEDYWTNQSVLMFDEMHIRERFEYCNRLKKIFRGYKKVQVQVSIGIAQHQVN